MFEKYLKENILFTLKQLNNIKKLISQLSFLINTLHTSIIYYTKFFMFETNSRFLSVVLTSNSQIRHQRV